MKIVIGDMWDELGKVDLILFTANSTVIKGDLVMGGGAAYDAKRFFPKAPSIFGEALLEKGLANKNFGVLIVDDYVLRCGYGCDTLLGAFQTKREVYYNSTLDIIKYSVDKLNEIAGQYESIAINMPGTGLGGLDPKYVFPIVEHLADNILVYKHE